MSKKHYILIAEAFKSTKPDSFDAKNQHDQWKFDLEAIAKVCEKDNPLFKKSEFLYAAGA